MNPKMEQVLWLLLWSVDTAMNPSYRNLFDSFEIWAYRNGLQRRLQYLESRKQVLKERKLAGTDFLMKLPECDRASILAGREPESVWSREWDGRWRMVLFDLPAKDRILRARLWRWLRANGYGLLQQSIWITPDPDLALEKRWRKKNPTLSKLALFDALPSAATDNLQVVESAWDFARINDAYSQLETHLEFLESAGAGDEQLNAWLVTEWELRKKALFLDPMLPRALHPQGYRGVDAWNKHAAAREKLREIFLKLAK